MGRFGFGQSRSRVEDARFLTGGGRYTDDIALPGQLHGYVLRSPHPHAEIAAMDTAAARAAPGVGLVLTGAELAADLPVDYVPRNRDGRAPRPVGRPVLARGRVRYQGEAVAFVVADSVERARDAAERIAVNYRPLPANADTAAALTAPQLHDGHPGNVLYDWALGDEAAVGAAFAPAARVVDLSLINNRLAPTALEPRGCIALPEGGGLTLIAGSQGVHNLHDGLCRVLGLPAPSLRVVTPDVGGAFGLKISAFPEHVLVLEAARRLNRPVKWIAGRRESFLSDTHGRDQVSTIQAALDGAGRILALKVDTLGNVGAYCGQYGAGVPTFGAAMLTGLYAIPALFCRIRGVFTNTTPTDSYRGAGRPEAAYLIERLMDYAAAEIGLEPDEMRRRNFIPPAAMPYRTAGGKTYDSGEFQRLMEMAMARAGWAGFPARRAQAARRGRLRGIGMSTYAEVSGGTMGEDVTLTVRPDGSAEVLVGTQSTGQGHETAFAQMVADELGLDLSAVRVVQGDTARIIAGGGTGGSRSLSQQGGAIARALDEIIAQGMAAARHLLQAPPDQIVFAHGRYRAGNSSVAFAEAAHLGPLTASRRFKPPASTFPYGCHVVEVEIDPDTGHVAIVGHTIVDDFGRVLNPLLLKGQIVGGAVQGLGQALLEHAAYDPATARLLADDLDAYALPKSQHAPGIDFSFVEIPCATHPLGVKGAGEAGTIGAPPAVVNAVVNALSPLGIRHLDMPATPLKLWSLIAAARAKGA